MRSFNDNTKFTQSLAAQVVTSDKNGVSVDMKNFGICRFLVCVGNSGDTLSESLYIELEVEESDDNSTWSDVDDADLSSYVDGNNDGCFAVIDAPAEDTLLFEVEYRGKKRYVRPVVNVTGTHSSGTPMSIVVAQGDPKVGPVS